MRERTGEATPAVHLEIARRPDRRRPDVEGEHGILVYGLMSALKGLGELGEAEEGLLLTKEGRTLNKKCLDDDGESEG